MEPNYYSLQMAHEATGYTREHLICLGAEGIIGFYVKNLRGYAVALKDDDIDSYFEELSTLEEYENQFIEFITVNNNKYNNIRFDHESHCHHEGIDIDDYIYHVFDTLPKLCRIPAFTLENYHVNRKRADFSLLYSPSEDKSYYLVKNIPMEDVQLYISKQDVAKLKNKEVVKKMQ